MSKVSTVEDNSITTRMLRSLYNEVTNHVDNSPLYTNEADFIRDAIREKLDREKAGS